MLALSPVPPTFSTIPIDSVIEWVTSAFDRACKESLDKSGPVTEVLASTISKDDVTVKHIEFEDKFENTDAMLVSQVYYF